jgi:hypothetical protein
MVDEVTEIKETQSDENTRVLLGHALDTPAIRSTVGCNRLSGVNLAQHTTPNLFSIGTHGNTV